MASTMVVAPSKDTLFIRGFSSRKDVEDIRDFFEKEARSKVLIEFLKQTETDDCLFVALKFETKDIAREILNRFDNTDVLGDNITLTWFKDLRRARAQGRIGDRDRRGRYDQHDYYNNRGYDRRYDHNRRQMDRNRMKSSRKYRRSRSRSPSYSRSRSRSRSRDRRDHSRSLSPLPKQRVKSAVEVQSSKKDDSDNERSSPMKESSLSPDRAYSRSPEPMSPSDDKDKDYSPLLDENKVDSQDSKRKESHRDDEDNDQDNTSSGRYKHASESYDDSRYSEDKYSSSRQSRSQQQSQRYMGDFDERENQQDSHWPRGALQDPSPDRSSERIERMSNASLDRERGNLDRSGMDGDPRGGMGRGSVERMSSGGGGVMGDYGGSMERRGYGDMYERNMWDGGMMQQGRRGGYGDTGPMRDGYDKDSRKMPAGEAERWLSMDGPQMGRWPGGQQDKVGGGWSQQTMAMIQEKKDDIERVYKNDCETFVSVVKMLINKDPQLEDRLQQSLRENLKDIGQRCILELREFIDRLREKEESQTPGLSAL